MGYQLVEGLSFGVVAGRAIFLNMLDDRYFCLSDAQNDAFLAVIAKKSGAPSRELAHLCDMRIVRPGNCGAAIAPVPYARPLRSLLPDAARLSFGALAPGIMLDRMKIRRTLSARPLVDIATQVDLIEERPTEQTLAAMREIVAPFTAADRIFGTADKCLSNSLALRRRLARNGLATNLIFGVRLMPFQAHCWLQVGDLAVNDDHDHVAQFTAVCVR